MDERICPIDPSHHRLILHEEPLDTQFPEYVQLLLRSDDFEGMVSGGMDGAFDDPNSCCCTAELVYLQRSVKQELLYAQLTQ
jgi:hypothetical protein